MRKNKNDMLANATKYHTKDNKKSDFEDNSLWILIIMALIFGWSNPQVEKLAKENEKMKSKLDVIKKTVVGDK